MPLLDARTTFAADNCGGSANATCTSAGNVFPDGIVTNSNDQILTLQSGVEVEAGANLGVWMQGSGSQTLNIAPDVTISTTGNSDAVLIVLPSFASPTGPVTVSAADSIVSTTGDIAYGFDLFSASTLTATVGTVTVEGDGGIGVWAQSSGGSVDVTTTGNVTTTGSSGFFAGFGNLAVEGIHAQGATSVTVDTTGGTVSMQGANTGSAIFAGSAGGPVEVTTADISISGNSQAGFLPLTGIFASSGGAGVNGAVTVNTVEGTVSLTGTTTSHAINATSANVAGGGAVSVTTADVSTKAAGAYAINATSNGTGANGAVTIDTTEGEISTEGGSARGISATSSAASNSGLVTVRTGAVTTTGSGASHAIFASSTSGAVTVAASGKLSTAGNGALGVSASGTGAVSVTTGDVDTGGDSAHGIQATSIGTVTIDSTAGTITTDGTGARGITVEKTGAAATTIHAGSISTTADEGQGIHVFSGSFGSGANGGAVTITAKSIATTGDSTAGNIGGGADGIEVITFGAGAEGKVVIDTSVGIAPNTLGSVSTTGDRSRGIQVQSGRLDVSGPVGGGAIEITAGNVSTEGLSAEAIDAVTLGNGADGAITINVLGSVSTKGDGPAGTDAGPARGINAVSFGSGGNVAVTAKNVSTEGDNATGIFAQSDGGTVTVDTTGGTVSTKGDAASGIAVGSSSGATTITTADVTTEGFVSTAIVASVTGPNSALTIDTTAGDITTLGEFASGINATTGSFVPGETNAGLLTIRSGNITSNQSAGIVANANGGSIEIDTTAGKVHTKGLNEDGEASTGISASIFSAGGVAKVKTGSIQIDGDAVFGQEYGVLVSNVGTGANGAVEIDTSAGTVTTGGRNVRGVGATSQGGPISITTGAISANGELATGVFASTFGSGVNGAIDLTVKGNVAATGEFGMGIFSFAGNNAGSTIDLTIEAGQSVMGGWQADPDLPGQFGAAAGVVVGGESGVRSLASLVTNAGSIGAWSDLAIATADIGCDVLDPENCPEPGLGYGWVGPGGGIEMQNNGTVTGYFRFGTGANLFHNNSADSLDLRDFADTDGNAIRDTERVAISDMGGPGATFDNDSAGWLRLLSVPGTTGDGAVTVDGAGAILQGGVHDLGLAGVEQGQIINTAVFRNAGTISMMDAETGGSGAVAGDVLVITGGGTAGADGNGIFRSDGGVLRIDTVLNEGGASSQSDLLVVDGTEVGAGGATRVFIANAGGTGLQTVEDGIKIVDVLDPTASAADAFVLGANVAAGGFKYDLFRGGVFDPNDGDWYLRSSELRNEVPLYASAPSAALLYGYTMLGTLHQRIGDPLPASPGGLTSDRFSGAWARAIHDEGEFRTGDFEENGPDFDYRSTGLQAGIDLLRREHGDGSEDVAGVYFGWGVGSADVDSFEDGEAGSVDFDGYSLGAYWTHFGPSGWYLDTVAQATHYGDLTAEGEGGELDTSGWGVIASIEAGYPIALPAGWRVEPQAQLVYQWIGFDDAADAVSRVDFGEAEGLLGRLGFRIAKDWGGAAQRPVLTTWLRANLWHEFLGESETTVTDLAGFNPLTTASDIGGTTGEVEIGLSAALTERASAFATGHAAFAIDGGDRSGYGGRAGLRLEW